MYAESTHKHAVAFNCYQRAHQNTYEWKDGERENHDNRLVAMMAVAMLRCCYVAVRP